MESIYPALLPEDIHRVVSCIPKRVTNLIKERKLFIAGGCIRAAIAGENIQDYDLFGPDVDTLTKAADDVAEMLHCKVHVTDNARTVTCRPRVVQFITRWTYDRIDLLLEQFDFTIAKAVIAWDVELEQWQGFCHPKFYADLAAKRLRYTMPERDEEPGGSLLRAMKFTKRGYYISPEQLGLVIARMTKKIDLVKYADMEEGMRGAVIAGILREVDPMLTIDGLDMWNVET